MSINDKYVQIRYSTFIYLINYTQIRIIEFLAIQIYRSLYIYADYKIWIYAEGHTQIYYKKTYAIKDIKYIRKCILIYKYVHIISMHN